MSVVASAIPVKSDKQLSRPDLNVAKLHGLPPEQQDLFLFTFSADLVRYISSLSNEKATREEKVLLQELMKLVRLSAPVSNRVVRSNIGCAFSTLFAISNRSGIFDTITELIGILQAGSKEMDLNTKYDAVVAVGDIFAAAGSSVAVRSNGAIQTLLKLLKAAQHHAGLKASIYIALKKVVSGAHVFVDGHIAKDVWKSARNAAGDKAYIVQASAISCLEELVKDMTHFDNASDFDNLKSTLWKAIDSPSQSVRHGAASCLAAPLVKAYRYMNETGSIQPAPRKSKQTNKRQSELQGEARTPERSASPSRKSEPRLAFNLSEMLKQLSVQYCKLSTSHRARVGIVICYKTVLRSLGEEVVEKQYPHIASHLFNSILDHPTVTNNRYRLLTTRKFVKSLLEDTVGRELLHESGRLNAAKWLVNNVIKDYPQVVAERPEPSKQTLTSALSALSSLTDLLQSAFAPAAESTREALLQALRHPSYTVQIHASQCLHSLILACPQQLMVCLTICMNSLTRELGQLSTPRQSTRRCLGLVYALSSMLNASRHQPLYGSVSIYAEIFEKATSLLKISTESELRVAATQIQVAWTLIGGLMSLGPNFTKIHLSQLFLLWKNALSKPFSKDLHRGPLEVSFLAHVRECALSSVFAFLEFNSRLVTHDGARRIATVLQNTILFLDYLPKPKPSDDISQRLMPSVQLGDLIIMVRRRVLQCFTKLVNLDQSNHSLILSMSNVLGHAVTCFADPDVTPPTTLNSSITNIPVHFDSLWELEDNFGFGVTGFVHEFNEETASVRKERNLPGDWSDIDFMEREIDGVLTTPICHAREHDPVLLYATQNNRQRLLPVPPHTGVVDAAIELFSFSLPFQPPKVQESIVEQIAALLSTQSLNRDPGRKAAMVVNIAVALLWSLRIAAESAPTAGDLKNPPTEKIIQELLLGFIVNPDPVVRCLSSEALGRLCNNSVDSFINQQTSSLIDMIIDNRDPNVRSGCALTLAHILSQVGVMAGSVHLKTIVGCLMSLCRDQHPIVHFWALDGLVKVTEAAGLTFSPYASGTLGTLARLYLSDTHNVMAPSFLSNLEDTFSTTTMISRCVDSLINVLGPDLRETSKTCELVLALLKQFGFEESTPIAIESARCLDHLALYSANRLDFKAYVRWLEKWLASDNLSMRAAAVHGINNLMKSDADLVIRNASHTFEDELWLALHDFVDSKELRTMFLNWLQQTGFTDTKEWIKRFQKVLNRGRAKLDDSAAHTTQQPVNPLNLDVLDEEAAGFASTTAEEQGEDSLDAPAPKKELLNWQTRAFVMSCLSDLLTMVQNEIQPDQTVPSELALRDSTGDIVKMAFSASTSGVLELRILGLKTFDKLLLMFGRTPDPDFPEASILEQYQAQIASAIAPAFVAESSPELVTEAINVCATFVSAGVVTNVDRMGRIFRPLLTGLTDLANTSDNSQIGDFRGLNTNARVMVRLALYSAWARLQIMSAEHSYLLDVVKPHTAMLTPLWLTSLQKYARLRFEPDISSAIPTIHRSEDVDETYASLNREILLQFYQNCWLNFVDAIASLVEKDSDFVFDALDGKFNSSEKESQESEGTTDERGLSATGSPANPKINYRNEPVAFFFLLFGLSFEALMNENIPSSQRIAILQALQKTLRPSIAGNSIYQPAVFSETMDTLDRMVMTEASNIQTVIIGIARNLSLDHPSASMAKKGDEQIYDEIEQLFELTRNIILVLVDHLPNVNIDQTVSHSRSSGSEDSAALIWLSLSSLVDVAHVFPSIIRNDLCACIIHIFMTILATASCQTEVAPQSLPIFRRFIQEFVPSSRSVAGGESDENTETISRQIRGCILELLDILDVAQRREFDTSLACAKNTLLALTIVFTLSGNVIPPQDPLLPRALDSFLDCLQDVGLSTVASGCMRTLLLGSQPRSPFDDAISRYLFPRLLAFITSTAIKDAEPLIDPENSKPNITQTLVSCVIAMKPEVMPAGMSMLVPAILQRARLEGADSYEELSARLVELVAANRPVFRGLMPKLKPQQSGLLEEILRSNVEKKKRQEAEIKKKNEPSIALRMDF